MRKIPDEIREKVVELWIQGHTYRAIGSRLMLSLGTISQIIKEAEKETVDLRFLKKLNKWLKKNDSSVIEALRGANLRQQLDELEITPELLQKFIDLTKNLASQNKIEQTSFTKAAIRLMNLEQTTEKLYDAIIQEYEEKQSKNTKLHEENAQLGEQITKQKQTLKKTKQEIKAKISEIKNLMDTQYKLKRIGIEKLEQLSQFIEDYEALGFDAQNVQDLYLLDRKLLELKITPKKLIEYISSEIAYRKKISDLKKETKKLETQISNQLTLRNNLLRQNPALKAADKIIRGKRIKMRCKGCNVPISRRIRSHEEYQNMRNRGLILESKCPLCGYQEKIHPNEELAEIALQILPKTRKK